MTAPVTIVPAVVDYLVTMFRTNVPARVKVFDGPPTVDDVPSDFVAVAYAEDEESSAVDGESVLSNFGNNVYAESFSVRCQISSFTGDAPLKPRRDRVSTLYTLLVGLVRADPSLGGIVRRPGMAEVAGFAWRQDPHEDGTDVTAVFDVQVVTTLWAG